jgi:peptide/nickel transport system permease protein
MYKFILNKFFYGVLVLIGVMFVIFGLFNILPVDPARLTLGQRADVESVEAINKELGLDKPKYVQFALYVNDLSPIAFITMMMPQRKNTTIQNYLMSAAKKHSL